LEEIKEVVKKYGFTLVCDPVEKITGQQGKEKVMWKVICIKN